MFKIHQQLIKDVDFDNAIYFGIPISVFHKSKIIDHAGVIEKHTEKAVYINGGYFSKEVFEFKVRKVSIYRNDFHK